MSEREPLTFKTTEETRSSVDAYQSRRDINSRSKALEELVQIGLRESNGPLLYRAKDHVVHVVMLLLSAAIVSVVVGVSLPSVSDGHAMEAGAILLLTAVGTISGLEVLRVLNGQHELGFRRTRE